MQSKTNELDKQIVTYKDLGIMPYKVAWDYQEELLQKNIQIKIAKKNKLPFVNLAEIDAIDAPKNTIENTDINDALNKSESTTNYLLLCEHPPVYTLGKSGSEKNILITQNEMAAQGISFFKTNRGGDITFHGLDQIVGYPILDLENFYTDIGRYLRELEEVIILTLAAYGIDAQRSKGETGVWIAPDVPGLERKICAMGVRCSRWITMHGFALNVNTNLAYFDNIIPCGIVNKKVTSIENELGKKVDIQGVKKKICINFKKVFNTQLIGEIF